MSNPTLRRWALGAAAVSLAFLSSLPAFAVDVGDSAPDFEGKEFFNTEAVNLKELRGRVVLLELFSVT